MKDSKDKNAIKKALKEAEEIFGAPVTFKVRNEDGELVEATQEDIVRVQEKGQLLGRKDSFKVSVEADIDGSKTTFKRTEGNNVWEESHYFPREKGFENRFEELEDSGNMEVDEENNNNLLLTDKQIGKASKGELKDLSRRIKDELNRRKAEQNSNDYKGSSQKLEQQLQKVESVLNSSVSNNSPSSSGSSAVIVASAIGATSLLIGGLVVWKKSNKK